MAREGFKPCGPQTEEHPGTGNIKSLAPEFRMCLGAKNGNKAKELIEGWDGGNSGTGWRNDQGGPLK